MVRGTGFKMLTWKVCSCGNKNEAKVVKSIHNKLDECNICDEFVFTQSRMLCTVNTTCGYDAFGEHLFNEFAEAWG